MNGGGGGYGGWYPGFTPFVDDEHKPPPKCPNCGSSKHEYVKHKECKSCGYKEPITYQLASARLHFCTKCGCHYLNACTNPDHCPDTERL